LLDEARGVNELLSVPVADSEIVAKCNHWWKKTVAGENRFGVGGFVTTNHATIDGLLMNDPDAFMLLLILRRYHWGRDFPVANDMCEIMPRGGWRRQRFTAARSRLIKAGFLVVVKPASFRPNRPMMCRLAEIR
jgi:hypothetical protein